MRIKKLVALLLCAMFCLQLLPASSLAAETSAAETSISGNGVRISYSADSHTITLYRMENGTALQMSKGSTMGYPIVGGKEIRDFTDFICTVEQNITGLMGAGERMTITSHSPSTDLTRTYILETSAATESAVYTQTTYTAGATSVTPTWFVDNVFEIYNPADRIWSYNGGGEGPIHYYDTLQKINLTDSGKFSRENIQDYSAASIPVADIYTANGGITVGDASATRREVHTPVLETANSAQVSIKWPSKAISAGNTAAVGQSFVLVHKGDYYNGLRGYKNVMEYLGMVMPTNVSSRSYDLRWESWGWGFNWTIDLIISKLDELKAQGVKQITLDDGWYNSPGDWGLDASKFPNGDADMQRLTNAIHSRGMTAILWWRPNDGGRDNSALHREHPEYFVQNANGSTAKLGGPGQTDNTVWFSTVGYALCPTSEGAIASQTAFINRAMNTWGFDGFKADYVFSMPKCYNTSHNHAYPEESTEKQSEFYRTGYEAMVANDPDVLNLLCNCGTPQDYYSLQYMTQVATADPTSVDQTRTRAKAYKALMGDYFPITTDHNEIWYPSAVGTGSVLIEKRALVGINLTEYERWLNIANTVQLQKGRFIGDLYNYGFDPYETYVVEKDGVMHYAFYRDGSKYQPSGYPDIELKGLDPAKMYRIVDYANNQVVATNLMGNNAIFNSRFSSSLLVKAEEITTPDPEPVDPNKGFVSVDAMDSSLVYTGTWHDDSNAAFDGGTARYTNQAGAAVELTFEGTTVRWYGQMDTNFGSAKVYLDGALVKTVNVNGSPATQLMLFEAFDLAPETHTIKIVCATPTIDIDRLTYEPLPPAVVYEMVDDTSDKISYTGEWTIETNPEFYGGSSRYSSDPNATTQMTFEGTAVRWYGRTGKAFRTADVFLDGALVENIVVYGEEANNKILFEMTGLKEGTHTIKIAFSYGAHDVDRLAFGSIAKPPVDPPVEEVHTVDAVDSSLVYTGTWKDDSNAAFQNGTARYTASAGAAVELAFTGTEIRWYGQKEINFGTAKVYVDDVLVETVNVNGAAAVGQLLFEKTGLANVAHTIRIECATPNIDVDYLTYTSVG